MSIWVPSICKAIQVMFIYIKYGIWFLYPGIVNLTERIMDRNLLFQAPRRMEVKKSEETSSDWVNNRSSMNQHASVNILGSQWGMNWTTYRVLVVVNYFHTQGSLSSICSLHLFILHAGTTIICKFITC